MILLSYLAACFYISYSIPWFIHLNEMCLQTNSNTPTEPKERKKKESIVDLSRYLEKIIRVKFAGGREVSGILKGYDPLVNLVLDNTTEYLRGQYFLLT